MTDITVCIPAYNCAKDIGRAINSVLRQTLSANVEILICDDGSTDDTLRFLKELECEHSSVRVIRNDSNRGRPFSRNHLVKEARGKYLTWLDADDEKYPEMMAHQYALLEEVRLTEGEEALEGLLVFTNFDWKWPQMETPKQIKPPQDEYHMEHLLNASFGGYLWLMMGTTETFRTVGPFDEELPRLQDLDFFLRFVQMGGRFRRIETEEPQCIYYKDDRARGSAAVWRSWTRIWKKHRMLFDAYGHSNAANWRRHHHRVARRFAKANGEWATYYKIATSEIFHITKHKIRGFIGV